MKIKSLLLGSAAALFAVSGAQAADAIIAAAPEPVEYVRVCDAFGTGYYYIPGTETCISVGGRIRVDYAFGDPGTTTTTVSPGVTDGYNQPGIRSRAYIYMRSAADTEYGALRTYTELRFTLDNNNGTYGLGAGDVGTTLNFAYIELGGLQIGKSESAFTMFPGYAGGVINADAVPYGPFDVHSVRYTYDAGNGFSAVVALEDDTQNGGEYIPDVVGGIGYDGGAFSARLVGGFDESIEEGAIKGRVDGSFGAVSAFVMAGYSTNGDAAPGTGGGTAVSTNRFAQWGGDWAVWGGLSADLTERLTFNSQVGYDDREQFSAAANVSFAVAEGFVVVPEVTYNDLFAEDDEWGGVIRFQRTF